MTQICSFCKLEKQESEFPPRLGKGKITRPQQCLLCRKTKDLEKQRKYRKNNPEKVKEQQKRTDSSRKDRWNTNEAYRTSVIAANKKYRESNKELLNSRKRGLYTTARKLIIEKYGGKCSCCGDTNYEFLAIDHVNGGGNEERKSFGTTQLVYKLSKIEEILPEYRILCHNCNSSYGHFGYCPHQKDNKI